MKKIEGTTLALRADTGTAAAPSIALEQIVHIVDADDPCRVVGALMHHRKWLRSWHIYRFDGGALYLLLADASTFEEAEQWIANRPERFAPTHYWECRYCGHGFTTSVADTRECPKCGSGHVDDLGI